MKKIWEFIKDKSYYFLGATVVIIILLVVINACSNSKTSYSSIEDEMVEAARTYFSSRESRLPKEEGNSVEVTVGTLIDSELLEEIKDPNDKNQTCEGSVQVKKVGDDYVYTPFLKCEGNYEPEYLADIVKNSQLDEYGNGVYQIDGEYVYRGDDVDNYITFNNQTWRIMRVTSDNNIKIILNQNINENYSWETSYNVNQGRDVGITSDYLNTNIRKTLVAFYDSLDEKSKSLLLKHSLCIGGVTEGEQYSKEKECSKTKEDEYVGLLNPSDFKAASLDESCTSLSQEQCSNRNYLISSAYIYTWTMNTVASNDYQVYIFANGKFYASDASSSNSINPVVLLTSDVIISDGSGSEEDPYVIK